MDFCKVHDFNDSLEIEREGFERQDKFYLEYFGHLPQRVRYFDHADIQKSDRDLYIENKAGELLWISEKNRTEDYTDVLFEIHSDYFGEKPGWGMNSEAKTLAYFLPSTIVLVDMEKMVKILSDPKNKMDKQVECYDEKFRHHDIWINGVVYNLPVIRAKNKNKYSNNVYYSVSIAFTDKQLKQLGVSFSRF